MLELRRVCKSFSGIRAVDNVSFTARPGEVTGYLALETGFEPGMDSNIW